MEKRNTHIIPENSINDIDELFDRECVTDALASSSHVSKFLAAFKSTADLKMSVRILLGVKPREVPDTGHPTRTNRRKHIKFRSNPFNRKTADPAKKGFPENNNRPNR